MEGSRSRYRLEADGAWFPARSSYFQITGGQDPSPLPEVSTSFPREHLA